MQWVILVPGFAASHLFRFAANSDRGTKVWLSQLDIAWNGINELDTGDDVSPPILNRVRPGSPLLEVYQPFLQFMASSGVPVLLHGYDWRTDVATNGQRLAAAIEAEVGTKAKFTIIAHSMGGLVAAGALNRLSDAAVPTVERLITCGTPWAGSFKALELFAGTHETVQQVVNLNKVFSHNNRYHWLRETVRVVASWPGSYDLLPMPELMRTYPPGPGQDFRSDGVFAKVNPWFTEVKYNQAVARRPIHVGFPPNIPHYNFRGIGRRTLGPSPTVLDGRPDYWFKALFGDGVVPEFSGTAPVPFNASNRDYDADHEQFLSDAGVLRAVGRIMGFLS